MTTVDRDDACSAPNLPSTVHPDDREWIRRLRSVGSEYDDAVRELHTLMVKGARHQTRRMPDATAALQGPLLDDIVQQSASEATLAVLRKLPTFEGRSRFTTWAYKFAILQTASELRRSLWRRWEVDLDATVEVASSDPGPAQHAEAADLRAAVAAAMASELTPHQQRVATALLIDEVPIDVLAERLGTTRNALYKTLHDARKRLRRHLIATDFLPASAPTRRRR